MIQLKVYQSVADQQAKLNPVFLDLYDVEPIKLTLSIEDITNADASSVFSKQFKVPATRDNNEFFLNAFEIDGIDFDVTTKKPAEILVDGAEFRQGHIRLQKIFTNNDKDRIDLEKNFEKSFPEIKYIKQVYQALGSYFQLAVGSGVGESFDFDIIDFCERYRFEIVKSFNALKVLEKAGWLMLTESIYIPSTFHIKIPISRSSRTVMKKIIFYNYK